MHDKQKYYGILDCCFFSFRYWNFQYTGSLSLLVEDDGAEIDESFFELLSSSTNWLDDDIVRNVLKVISSNSWFVRIDLISQLYIDSNDSD